MKSKIINLFVILLVSANIHAVESESRIFKDAASMGMGGVGVSTIGYSFSPIYNPAALGLMQDHDIAPFLTLGISINPQMTELLKHLHSMKNGTFTIDSVDYDGLLGSAPSLGINGPLTLGYMGKGFGFWTTSSADMGIMIKENPDNIFTKNNLNVSMNKIAAAGNEYLKLTQNGHTITQTEAEELFNKYLGKDLKQQGLSDEEIRKTIEYITTKIQNDPDTLKELLPVAKLSGTAEITVNLAYAFRIPFSALDDVSGLSFGATVRFSQRFRIDTGDFKSIDTIGESFNNISSQVYQAGSISSDFGAALRLQNFVLGVSVLDALSSQYQWKNFDGISGLANSQIPWALNFGASYRFYWTNKFLQEVSMYIEFEDAANKFDTWLNKLRIGTEVKLFNFLNLRVGMYDAFVTGGVGFDWKWFRIDFAYYRENYFNWAVSDQFYLNMTLGLENTPQRKARSLKKQQQQDRIQSQALELINKSLDGIPSDNAI